MDAISPDQMRTLEREAMDSGAVGGFELMERAGRAVVDAIYETFPQLSPISRTGRHHTKRKAVIMCGPGNNGGDGFIIADLLRLDGWQVCVYFFGDAEKFSADAARAYKSWLAHGTLEPLPEADPAKARLRTLYDPHPDLWVDALFGIGLNRALPDDVTAFLQRVYYEQNWCKAPVVAVDIVSGLNAETGFSVQDFHLTADLTVTFHAAKTGHLINDGPMRSGKLVVKDIGL